MDNKIYYDVCISTQNGEYYHSISAIEELEEIMEFYFPIYIGIQMQLTMLPHYDLWEDNKNKVFIKRR